MPEAAGIVKLFSRLHRDLRREAEFVTRQASPTAVHRTRVAARRLRSLAAAIPGLRDSRAQNRCIRDLRALAHELAPVREADVLREGVHEALKEFTSETPSARRHVAVLLDQERAPARRQLRPHTRSLAWSERLERVDRSLRELQSQLARIHDGQGLARSMLLESAQAVAKATREEDGSASQLHRLRVQAKAFRYVVEVLAKALALDSERLAKSARAAQQTIGRYLDARHARKWVARHRELLAEPLGSDLERHLGRQEKRAFKDLRRALRKIAK